MAIRYVGDAIDLSVWQPPQRVLSMPDGDTVIEKIPSMPNMKMVNRSGGVVFIGLANGMGKPVGNDPYRSQKLPEKQKQGFVPYGKCPKSIGLNEWVVGPAKDLPPCKVAADGSPIGPQHPCRCIVEIIEARTKANIKRDTENETRHRSKEMRETEIREKQISASNQVNEKLTEVLNSLAPPKKTRGKEIVED